MMVSGSSSNILSTQTDQEIRQEVELAKETEVDKSCRENGFRTRNRPGKLVIKKKEKMYIFSVFEHENYIDGLLHTYLG